LKDSALLYLPAVVQAAPATAPFRLLPEASVTVVPVPSLKLYATTSPPGKAVEGLFTVSVTAADKVVFPAPSRAEAVRVWDPLGMVVVSQEIEYGEIVSSLTRFTPSRRNCTPFTPTLSEAEAVTVTVPTTLAPAAGAVMDTTGAWVSG